MSESQRLSGFCTVIVLPPLACDIRSADITMRLWQILVIFQCILKERSIGNFIVPWHLVVATRKSRTPESRTPVIQLIGAMTPLPVGHQRSYLDVLFLQAQYLHWNVGWAISWIVK